MTSKTENRKQSYLLQKRLVRETALRYLYQADFQDDWELSLEKFGLFWEQMHELEGAGEGSLIADPRIHAEVEALVGKVAEHRGEVEAAFMAVVKNWTLAQLRGIDRNILRLATTELLCCPEVPAAVIINEAVEMSKDFSHEDASRFVNGILDKVARSCRDVPSRPKA
jgi:N utilization substance protein B